MLRRGTDWVSAHLLPIIHPKGIFTPYCQVCSAPRLQVPPGPLSTCAWGLTLFSAAMLRSEAHTPTSLVTGFPSLPPRSVSLSKFPAESSPGNRPSPKKPSLQSRLSPRLVGGAWGLHSAHLAAEYLTRSAVALEGLHLTMVSQPCPGLTSA